MYTKRDEGGDDHHEDQDVMMLATIMIMRINVPGYHVKVNWTKDDQVNTK